jgi:hypothetical protein
MAWGDAMTRNFVAGCSAAFIVAVWLAYPALNYRHGTSENMTVEVVAEPFGEGDNLVYRWSGDLVRSCDVTLRRVIIDADNVITNLTPRAMAKVPLGALGYAEYEMTIPVPLRIAEGPAVYQAIEIPACSWLQRLFPVAVPYPPVEFTVTR